MPMLHICLYFFQQMITAYLVTLFFGKYEADGLLKHLYQMLDRIELLSDMIDSPLINMSFNQ